jgi:hypothetical protein
MATYEQPGRTETQDQSGKKTLTITYVGDAVATAPTVSNASLYSRTVVTAEAGMIRTTFQYNLTQASGALGGASPGGSIAGIEIVGSLRTVPLQAHPRYKDLTAEEQKEVRDFVQNPISGSKALPASWSNFAGVDMMAELATKLLEGQESYYEPSVILRKTTFSSTIPSGDKLGKISDPEVDYDSKPEDSDWLLVNVSARGQSGAYTITQEYELSGEGGWDEDIYSP